LAEVLVGLCFVCWVEDLAGLIWVTRHNRLLLWDIIDVPLAGRVLRGGPGAEWLFKKCGHSWFHVDVLNRTIPE